VGQDSGPVYRDKFGNLSHMDEARSPEAKPTGESADTPVSLAFVIPVRFGRPIMRGPDRPSGLSYWHASAPRILVMSVVSGSRNRSFGVRER